MLLLTYWELNEGMSVEQRQQIAQKLLDSGLFPPPNVNILRWDTTPDGWGILLAEADNVQDFFKALNTWRAAGAGFFKCTKTAPALPVQEGLSTAGEVLERLASTS